MTSTVRGALFTGVLAVSLITVANTHSAAHSSVPAGGTAGAPAAQPRFDPAHPPYLLGTAQLVRSDAATAPPPAAPSPAVPAVPTLPPRGGATAYGCGPALEYLAAYAAPGFVFQCPAYAGGHQATTTCVSAASRCSLERLITIADPCPAAYMNEASNSFVVMGLSDATIDPYGYCR